MKKMNFINLIYSLLFVSSVLMYGSCKKDKSLIEENGLTRDINNFVPQDIIDALDSLGMPINKGGNPGSIEGSYFVSPNVLRNTNIEGDVVGKIFLDETLTFSMQNNEDLTITTTATQGSDFEGVGYGSFIVGEGDNFTVFSKLKSYIT